MFGLTNGNKKPKFLGPKAINRQQLLIQNLIFIFLAVIIILLLGFIIISELDFLVNQINMGLRVNRGTSELTSFNLEKLDLIKEKLPDFIPEISSTPISTSTIPVATSTETTVLPEIPLITE